MLEILVTSPDGQGGYKTQKMTMSRDGGRREIRDEAGSLIARYTRTNMPINLTETYGKPLASVENPDGQPLGDVYNNGLMKDEGDVIANAIQWEEDDYLQVYPASIGIRILTTFDDQTAVEEAFGATGATYLAFYAQVRAR